MTGVFDVLDPPREPVTTCQRGCCWNPFFGTCGRSRQCRCHVGDPVLSRTEAPISRVLYTDHTANTAIARVEGPRRRRT